MLKFKNKIQIHDTDYAKEIHYPMLFRFATEAFQEFFVNIGVDVGTCYKKGYYFVVVHCESRYYVPLHVEDEVVIHLYVENIGKTSLTLSYKIYKSNHLLVGSMKTVHVFMDLKSGEKKLIFPSIKKLLEKHLEL